MPSLDHEAFLLLFRHRPELAPELLREALGVTLPAYAEARIESAELTEAVPTEYRADLVILLVDGKPVLGIVVEAQLTRDERKRYSWPVYAVSLRARLECPTCVLVVTASERVAAWAREPTELGPGASFQPLVLGPSSVPIVREPERARRDPELVVLSAMAHGRKDPEVALAIAKAAVEGVAEAASLDEERAFLYFDLVSASLGEAARKAFEELMANGHYEFQSEFAKKHYAEGRAEGEARAVLAVLDARGIAVTEAARQRILACSDLAVLDRWVRRAVSVETADALFSHDG